MALKLTKKPDYYWPVEIKIPVDGGRYESSRFDALFRRVPQSEVETMMERIKAGEVTYRDLLRQPFVGESGLPESFNVLIKELQSLALDVELMESPEAQKAREMAEAEAAAGGRGAEKKSA